FGPAASKVYGAKGGVSIGGYGEMLYQNFHSRADDGRPSGAIDTADLERAVLYFGYKWTDHLLFNSEVEYEHAVVAPDAPGEAAGVSAGEWAREGRQEGAEATARNGALSARVDCTPAPGLLFGAAGFTGDAGQGGPGLGGARLSLWDAHAEWNAHGWHFRGLYARGTLGRAGAVSLANDPLLAGDPARGTAIGSRAVGWYGEVAW